MGAVWGSVANAVIYRLPKSIPWTRGKSVCPSCGHTLASADLTPLLSWLLLRGKCRYCKKNIGWRYFVVEAVMGIGFAVLTSLFGWGAAGLIIGFWASVVIAVMDWETSLVSDAMCLVWLAGILLWQWSTGLDVGSSILGILVSVGMIGGIWAYSRGKAMGFGDVEIAAVFGWWLGWPLAGVALWIAFVSGAVVGVAMIATRKTKIKATMPFGPFLVIGAWLAWGLGDKLLAALF